MVVFVLAASRAPEVPQEHLGPDASGIRVVDRYKAYSAIEPVQNGPIVLAFCWAQVRRDLVTWARTWPEQEAWALAYVERIGAISRRNDARLAALAAGQGFDAAEVRRRAAVTVLQEQAESAFASPWRHPACRAVLERRGNPGTGLTVFVEHPAVPMDNPTAERAARGPVLGRKNDYGWGAVWSGRLAAMRFSLLQTLSLGTRPLRSWLTAYWTACAEAGGKAPGDVSVWLPWHRSAEQPRSGSLAAEQDENVTSSRWGRKVSARGGGRDGSARPR